MLSDPLSVTYNSSVKSLARTGPSASGVKRVLSKTGYNTADGEFRVNVTQSLLGNGSERAEILLTRLQLDPDGPFTGNYVELPNSVGLVFETNQLKYNASTDIPLLQAALTTLVDATLRGRLIGGES